MPRLRKVERKPIARTRRRCPKRARSCAPSIAVELVEGYDVVAGDHGRRAERGGHAGGFTVGAHHPPRCDRRRARTHAAARGAAPPRDPRRRRLAPGKRRHALRRAAARRVVVADFELRSSAPANARRDRAPRRASCAPTRYSHVLVATEDPGGYRLAGAVGAPVRIGFADRGANRSRRCGRGGCSRTMIYRSAGLDRRAPHECEMLFRLGAPLLDGDAEPTRDLAALRPLVVESRAAADERIAVQITDKWERLGIRVRRRRRARPPRRQRRRAAADFRARRGALRASASHARRSSPIDVLRRDSRRGKRRSPRRPRSSRPTPARCTSPG